MAKSYTPSYKRVKHPPPMRLTERDKEIILAVHEYRLLSSQQVEALFFPSSNSTSHSRRSACQRRLQLLFHHCFLDRLSLPLIMGEGRSPFVYSLGRAGADIVAAELGVDRQALSWKPKENNLGALFLDHNLAINDLRVTLNLLAQCQGWKIGQWISEHRLRADGRKEHVPSQVKNGRLKLTYPDGYFFIEAQTGEKAHFFLEVDRGTMSNKRWQDKIRSYEQFRYSGRSEQYFSTKNFRLLVVASSPKRLINLKQASEAVGGGSYYWFTTDDQVSIWQPRRLLEPIWEIAGRSGQHCLL